VIFGFVFKATSTDAQDIAKKLRSIKPIHTFLPGMAVMLKTSYRGPTLLCRH
jgi:hypothetical protein